MGGIGSGRDRYFARRRRTHELPAIRIPRLPASAPLDGWVELAADGIRHSVRITATVQPFGGHRRWFRCQCYRRCAVLYLASYGPRCRLCLGLSYRTQNMTRHHRLQHRADKLWARVSFEDERGWRMPLKGVRRRTFDRVADLAEEYEAAAGLAMLGMVATRIGLAAPTGLRRRQ